MNPFYPLYVYAKPENEEQYSYLMRHRMDEIRQKVAKVPLLLVESAYVRIDSRRKGIFKMMLNTIQQFIPNATVWINLEPTSGDELTKQFESQPIYSIAEVGQLNENAAIAEKLGFDIESRPWRSIEKLKNKDGKDELRIVEIRKLAYRMNDGLIEITKDDGELVRDGYALQDLKGIPEDEEPTIDIQVKVINDIRLAELQLKYSHGRVFYITGINDSGNEKYIFSDHQLIESYPNYTPNRSDAIYMDYKQAGVEMDFEIEFSIVHSALTST